MNDEINGENSVEKTEKRPKGFLWRLDGTIAIFILLLVISMLNLVSVFLNARDLSVISLNMKVEAVLLRTGENHIGGGGDQLSTIIYYYNYYEYIAEDGMVYSGRTRDEFLDKSDAEARIGEKIYIYIDGKGYSVEDTGITKDTGKTAIILSSIFLPITTAFGIIFLIPHRWKNPYSYPKKKKNK